MSGLEGSQEVSHHDPLKISVITAVRNNREFVRQTIDSVLSQDYAHIEYIVIDGGSHDGTLDIIKAYDGRLAKRISEPDMGIADAFNKGLALSTGDYLLFLNSDDHLASPNAVTRMVRAIEESRYPDLIYGDCDLIERESGRYLYTASIDFSARAFKLGRTLPHPSLFTRRSYFEKHGQFDTHYRIAMDYEFLLRGALASRIEHVRFVVTKVRDGGVSTNSARVVPEIISALRKNRFIRTTMGARALAGYFKSRAMLRRLKESLRRSGSAR
jgi:glycosyltransferase involved in cell wall biosynthesis